MFGVVPKSIWSRTNPPDDNNMCSWAMRCLLVEYSDRLVLIDTGIGNKQSEKFFSYYYLFGDDTLQGSLRKLGFGIDEITDVVLTHLHFDHCGGAIQYHSTSERYVPAFPNARYWSNERHWAWATAPNAREKASFLKENILPIAESGQLHHIPRMEGSDRTELFPGFSVFFADGHTESQMIPIINHGSRTLAFCADLLPSASHLPLPYVMGYDVRPLVTLSEKEKFLNEAVHGNYVLVFEHDLNNEAGVLERTERGIRLLHGGKLTEFMS